jgi:hypothetical protein
MRLVTDQPNEFPAVWRWLNGQTRLPWSSDLRTIGAMRDDGTIAAAVGYNGWGPDSVWMHVAFDGPHSLTRGLWRAAFEYPFKTVGVSAVYGLTPKHLEEANKMNEKLGFQRISETVDAIIWEMRGENCRWIKERKHGRQGISTSTT